MEQPSPSQSQPVTRRTVLKIGLVGLLGAAAGAGSTAVIARLGRSVQPRYRFFTEAEAALLIDICEQLIPADDTPGATDAGVIHYIDWQLDGVFAHHQQTYRRGLESFRLTCREKYAKTFAELGAAEKFEALRAIEQGSVPPALWRDPSAPAFFNLILAHTMQGFYGSPRHGGNRNYASYRMLGLDYPPVVGRNRHPET